MALNKRLPLRDPRTVARDIPGVLDIIFPRLSGGLVASLNRKMVKFPSLEAIPDEKIEASNLQKSMLFELAVARAEALLTDGEKADWETCLNSAIIRQRKHFDARIPTSVSKEDYALAELAAQNLLAMLRSLNERKPEYHLEINPLIPGLGWIASGAGDFALGPVLIEVKHTDRNFVAGDFRQILIYWLLKYAASLEDDGDVWTDCVLLNPRRNTAISVNFDYLVRSASANMSRLEAYELMRTIVSSGNGTNQ